MKDILLTGCVYAFLIFSFNLFVLNLSRGIGVENIKQEINSLKANEEVFRTLLTQQTYYEVSKDDSQILFGNLEAKLQITILTNLFCNPCAKMHARVEKLLKETKGNICIQYIFSSFNSELDYANKSMIAFYLEKGKDAAVQLYGDWFIQGRTLRERFFVNLGLDMSDSAALKPSLKNTKSGKQKRKYGQHQRFW